jgi:septum formation protein
MWMDEITIVLGSGSPRRKELLEKMGLSIVLDVRPVEESLPSSIQAEEAAAYLARLKASAFSKLELKSNEVLVTADTLVIVNNQVLGKPTDEQEAYSMLNQLSGNVHQVITGVFIATNKHEKILSIQTDVWFNTLSVDEINHYIATFSPMDKAGAYGIQEWIGKIGIRKIDGCFYNVMGLPTSDVYTALKELTNKK